MWKNYELPLSCNIDGQQFKINADWRNIIDIFECLNAGDLLFQEKLELAIEKFYEDYKNIKDIKQSILYLYTFINGNDVGGRKNSNSEQTIRLIDWNNDLPLIIPPVNRVLGYDIRERNFVHWWTFWGAFNEIGECSLSTYINIRYKIAKKRKLEKWERELYLSNKDKFEINKKNDYEDFDDEDILVQIAKEKQSKYIIDR